MGGPSVISAKVEKYEFADKQPKAGIEIKSKLTKVPSFIVTEAKVVGQSKLKVVVRQKITWNKETKILTLFLASYARVYVCV